MSAAPSSSGALDFIRRTANMLGYRVSPPPDGDDGYPDLTLVLPTAPGRRGGVRFAYVTSNGELTSAQRDWRAALVESNARADVVVVPSGIDAYVAELVDESTLR